MSKTKIPDADPVQDTQYVGAYPDPCLDRCCDYQVEFEEDVERCGEPATHTVVMRDSNGQLYEIITQIRMPLHRRSSSPVQKDSLRLRQTHEIMRSSRD